MLTGLKWLDMNVDPRGSWNICPVTELIAQSQFLNQVGVAHSKIPHSEASS